MDFIRRAIDYHQKLKHKIHSTRIPLGPAGRIGMGVFYLVSPVVAGYYIMQWTNKISERNLGVYRDGSHETRSEQPKIAQSAAVKQYVEFQKEAVSEMLHEIDSDQWQKSR